MPIGRPTIQTRKRKSVQFTEKTFDRVKLACVRHKHKDPSLLDESDLIERAVREWLVKEGYTDENLGL